MTEQEEVIAARHKMRQLVRRAQLKKSLIAATKIYKKYPKNAVAQFLFAVAYGDSIISGFDSKADPYKEKAAKMLKPLLKRKREFPKEFINSLVNEYFWFSGQSKKQYQLGVRNVKKKDLKGYYSMGVGAWCVARKYALKSDALNAEKWAKESIRAWEEYFKIVPDYYNAWSWYARPLFFLNKSSKANSALKNAMNLSGKSKNFLEFKDVVADSRMCRELCYAKKVKLS